MVWVWSLVIGLWGASTSAKRATTSSTATMAAPMRAVVLRRSRRTPCSNGDSERAAVALQATSGAAWSSASWRLPPLMARGSLARCSRSSVIVSSGVPDPWIQEGVREIDDQIDDDERERRYQGEALDLLVVARDDGVDAEGAEARHREERLHHDRASDEEADLEAHDGHGRDQRVLQRVLQHDRSLAQALGARGRDVLGADDLEHAGAEQPREERGPSHAERQGGHQHVLGIAPEPRRADHGLARTGQVHPARARQPSAQADGENQEQQNAEEELRNGDPHHGHGARRDVGPGVLAKRADDGGGGREPARPRHATAARPRG